MCFVQRKLIRPYLYDLNLRPWEHAVSTLPLCYSSAGLSTPPPINSSGESDRKNLLASTRDLNPGRMGLWASTLPLATASHIKLLLCLFLFTIIFPNRTSSTNSRKEECRNYTMTLMLSGFYKRFVQQHRLKNNEWRNCLTIIARK